MHTYRSRQLPQGVVRYVVVFDTGGESEVIHHVEFYEEAEAIRLVSILNGGSNASEQAIRNLLAKRADTP
jgi:hypothetical protein